MTGVQLAALVLLALLAVAVAARLRSLWRPAPFPPWLTPLLESPLRLLLMPRGRTLDRSGLRPGTRVLEVGPGAGTLTGAARERLGARGQLVCLDLQIEMLRKVRARLGAETPLLVQASGSALPFSSEAFDLVFLVTVLGEIPDKRAAVREYARVLRPGGELAVTEAFPDPDYVRAPVLRRLARAAGFELRECTGTVLSRTHRFARP